MGARMTMEEAKTAVVTKTTSGILILPEDGSIDVSYTHLDVYKRQDMGKPLVNGLVIPVVVKTLIFG